VAHIQGHLVFIFREKQLFSHSLQGILEGFTQQINAVVQLWLSYAHGFLRVLLKCRCWFHRCGMGSKGLLSTWCPDTPAAAGQEMTQCSKILKHLGDGAVRDTFEVFSNTFFLEISCPEYQ
jgi:hypothetical protein